ncbi:hypothetical protein DQP56_10295 [Mycolicibacter senuensis]|nr:hypothetical protein DQP56_10295 [Mycolicibacter senuensis]
MRAHLAAKGLDVLYCLDTQSDNATALNDLLSGDVRAVIAEYRFEYLVGLVSPFISAKSCRLNAFKCIGEMLVRQRHRHRGQDAGSHPQ